MLPGGFLNLLCLCRTKWLKCRGYWIVSVVIMCTGKGITTFLMFHEYTCKPTQSKRIPTCICGRVIQCRSAPGRYLWPWADSCSSSPHCGLQGGRMLTIMERYWLTHSTQYISMFPLKWLLAKTPPVKCDYPMLVREIVFMMSLGDGVFFFSLSKTKNMSKSEKNGLNCVYLL